VDPSYRLINDLLHVPSQDDAEFYAFIRAHTNIRADVRPIDIDLDAPLGPGAGRTPNIILIVVDSLRRDYLRPYNAAAAFTPAIAAFARDSVVFERAFTRYGGTGLSMPSLWTGGMVLHKQYITPYYPMSTLAKLLDAERYTKVLSPDHITVEMIPPGSSYVELDRGRVEMQYQACRTLDEMSGVLAQPDLRPPVFAHTRSLDLHIAHVRRFPVPPGKSYPGFLAPVAAAVEQIDACFGAFVERLKQERLYDDSIIVLTADHGDSLGERLTWGHALTLYPEVLRIPLIVHLPDALRGQYLADPHAVAFLADLTPTLYELLGHPPADLGPLFGRPLFAPRAAPAAAGSRDSLLVGSSYGAVYGVLHDGGRKLYIADGINEREFAYELGAFTAVRVGIAPEERERHRTFIRHQVESLARLYHYQPSS
jgi:arylsulfatase A-like enzyme